jgi:Domain of unknown function (DUF4082)
MAKLAFLYAVFLLVCGLFLPHPAEASAISFSSAPTSSDSQISLGWQFTTLQDITVESLGYYDDSLDGFATPHEVGIFDSSGNLIVSSLLDAGTTDPLIDQFRYQVIMPLFLPAGATYTIAATTDGPSDAWAYGYASTTIVNFAVDPAIQVASDAGRFDYQSDNVLRDPVSQFGYTVYAGPNFLIAAAIPELSSFLLLSSGLFMLIIWRLKKSHSPKNAKAV